MTKIIFDKVARDLELVIASGEGPERRGRISLSRIVSEDGDFVLEGTGHVSGEVHRFALREVREMVDMQSGEKVDIAEFRTELETHPG